MYIMRHLESAMKPVNGQRQRNSWWSYVVMTILVLVVAPVPGSIPLFLVMAARGGGSSMDFAAYGVDLNLGLFLQLLPFLFSFVALMVLVKPMHNRTFKQVINGRDQLRVKRIFIGAALWAVLILFGIAVDYYLNINDYEVRYNLDKLLVLITVSILMLPFQAFFEEIFVRGYLAQGVGVLTRNRILVIFMPSLLFALLHVANPEVQKHGFWLMMSNYFVIGLVLAVVTTLDDGLELAMGAHAANNIMVCIFVTSGSSALQTDAILKDLKDVSDYNDVLVTLLIGIAFLGVLGFKYKWSLKHLFRKIELPAEIEEHKKTDTFSNAG